MMGQIIATCGHPISVEWMRSNQGGIFVKDYSRIAMRSISFRQVCPECLEWYRKEKLILETEQEKNKWLRIRKKPIGKRKGMARVNGK